MQHGKVCAQEKLVVLLREQTATHHLQNLTLLILISSLNSVLPATK